jgi:hypothetical protein
MMEKSWQTDLGKRWRGRVILVGVICGLCGDIVMAAAISSPRMAWMSLDMPRINTETRWGSSEAPVGLPSRWCVKESKRELAMALAKDVAA